MVKARRPRFRINDRVTLAEHTPLIPAYSGKPFVGRETVLRVSSIVGKGTISDPWGVNITDDAGHFWHLSPGDLVLADAGGSPRHHATKKSAAQLDVEIAEVLGRYPYDEPELRTKYRVEPSELRVGMRFDYFGQPFEIVKIGRDKAKTIQIARRYATPSGKEDFFEHKSFPMRALYQQHLRPLRD